MISFREALLNKVPATGFKTYPLLPIKWEQPREVAPKLVRIALIVVVAVIAFEGADSASRPKPNKAMKRRRFLAVLIGVLIFGSNSFAQVTQGQVKAETGGVAIGGDVRESNIIIGVPAERIDELVRERKPLEDLSASQKETIVLLKDKLDLNERQIRAALETVGEKDIPPERLAAKLIEIAQKFNDLKSASTAQPGDDAEIEALRQQVQAAIDSGDLARADSVLAQIEMKQRTALDRLASNAAATVGRRGEVALARLHYLDAAKQFAEAARLLPQTDDFSKQSL
jgi:hypothetical protein